MSKRITITEQKALDIYNAGNGAMLSINHSFNWYSINTVWYHCGYIINKNGVKELYVNGKKQ